MRWAALLSGLVVAMVLVACGGGDSPASAPDATEAPAATRQPAATEPPSTATSTATRASEATSRPTETPRAAETATGTPTEDATSTAATPAATREAEAAATRAATPAATRAPETTRRATATPTPTQAPAATETPAPTQETSPTEDPTPTPTAAPPPPDPTPTPTQTAADVPDEAVVAALPKVYFVHTQWWPQCKRLRPVWEELQQEYEGRIEFLELDLDDRDDEAVARDHGIFYQPGFIIYSAAGDLVHNQPGPNSGDEMRRLVASALEEG